MTNDSNPGNEERVSSDSNEAIEESRRRIRAMLRDIEDWQKEHPVRQPEGTLTNDDTE